MSEEFDTESDKYSPNLDSRSGEENLLRKKHDNLKPRYDYRAGEPFESFDFLKKQIMISYPGTRVKWKVIRRRGIRAGLPCQWIFYCSCHGSYSSKSKKTAGKKRALENLENDEEDSDEVGDDEEEVKPEKRGRGRPTSKRCGCNWSIKAYWPEHDVCPRLTYVYTVHNHAVDGEQQYAPRIISYLENGNYTNIRKDLMDKYLQNLSHSSLPEYTKLPGSVDSTMGTGEFNDKLYPDDSIYYKSFDISKFKKPDKETPLIVGADSNTDDSSRNMLQFIAEGLTMMQQDKPVFNVKENENDLLGEICANPDSVASFPDNTENNHNAEDDTDVSGVTDAEGSSNSNVIANSDGDSSSNPLKLLSSVIPFLSPNANKDVNTESESGKQEAYVVKDPDEYINILMTIEHPHRFAFKDSYAVRILENVTGNDASDAKIDENSDTAIMNRYNIGAYKHLTGVPFGVLMAGSCFGSIDELKDLVMRLYPDSVALKSKMNRRLGARKGLPCYWVFYCKNYSKVKKKLRVTPGTSHEMIADANGGVAPDSAPQVRCKCEFSIRAFWAENDNCLHVTSVNTVHDCSLRKTAGNLVANVPTLLPDSRSRAIIDNSVYNASAPLQHRLTLPSISNVLRPVGVGGASNASAVATQKLVPSDSIVNNAPVRSAPANDQLGAVSSTNSVPVSTTVTPYVPPSAANAVGAGSGNPMMVSAVPLQYMMPGGVTYAPIPLGTPTDKHKVPVSNDSSSDASAAVGTVPHGIVPCFMPVPQSEQEKPQQSGHRMFMMPMQQGCAPYAIQPFPSLNAVNKTGDGNEVPAAIPGMPFLMPMSQANSPFVLQNFGALTQNKSNAASGNLQAMATVNYPAGVVGANTRSDEPQRTPVPKLSASENDMRPGNVDVKAQFGSPPGIANAGGLQMMPAVSYPTGVSLAANSSIKSESKDNPSNNHYVPHLQQYMMPMPGFYVHPYYQNKMDSNSTSVSAPVMYPYYGYSQQGMPMIPQQYMYPLNGGYQPKSMPNNTSTGAIPNSNSSNSADA